MEVLVYVVALVVGGAIVGGLARLAVPGPDPMPFWATAVLGIAGSLLGGVVTWLIFGVPPGLLVAMVGAVVLLITYRKLVQERGITGPEARRPPTRGWWLPKAPRPRPRASMDKLERLRDAGVITEEEYAVKVAEVGQPVRPAPGTYDKLERLRDAGVITEEEYAVKVAEVSRQAAETATADTDAPR